MILAKDPEARERLRARLSSAFADGAIPAARVRLNRFDFGPPVGFPVQFRVIGPDPLEVRQIAYRVRDVVRGTKTQSIPTSTGTSACPPSAWRSIRIARGRWG